MPFSVPSHSLLLHRPWPWPWQCLLVLPPPPCVCVQILSLFQVPFQMCLRGHLSASSRWRPCLPLDLLWPGQQESLLWASLMASIYSIQKHFGWVLSSLPDSRLLSGRIWFWVWFIYFLQLSAQHFTRGTSPVGVCEMSRICLYHVFFFHLVLITVSVSSLGLCSASFWLTYLSGYPTCIVNKMGQVKPATCFPRPLFPPLVPPAVTGPTPSPRLGPLSSVSSFIQPSITSAHFSFRMSLESFFTCPLYCRW